MRAPDFWRDRADWRGRALAPLGALYTRASHLRAALAYAYRPAAKVVCCGNPTLGGAGKTPLVRWLVDWAEARGMRPIVISRGHGGGAKGPLEVDPDRHDARLVGDEPSMLARGGARVIVAKDRAAAARAADLAGAGLIVMDDGLQNPSVAKDVAIGVVDGGAGFGNGRVFPAGPLREPIEEAFARCAIALIIGEDRSGAARAIEGARLLFAELAPVDTNQGRGRRALVFAGIGRPDKAFSTARAVGFEEIETRSFADHHRYSDDELDALRRDAGARVLVTTEKDAARIGPERAAELRLEVLEVKLAIADEAALIETLERALDG